MEKIRFGRVIGFSFSVPDRIGLSRMLPGQAQTELLLVHGSAKLVKERTNAEDLAKEPILIYKRIDYHRVLFLATQDAECSWHSGRTTADSIEQLHRSPDPNSHVQDVA